LGTYTDDFATTPGITTSSGAGVDTTTGVIQLRNASSTYTAPYNTTGYVKTAVIRPVRIARWGTLSVVTNIPDGTSIKMQILDDSGNAFSDIYIPGNSTGFTTFPFDLSNVSPFFIENQNGQKIPMIEFKFILSTNNTSVTPTIDSIALDWTLTQGDLTTSSMDISSPKTVVSVYDKLASKYSNESIYPAYRWISEKKMANYWQPEIYILRDRLFAIDGFMAGHMFTLNRDTGETTSSYPWSGSASTSGAISENGTLFGANITDDIIYALDTNNSTVKWVYKTDGGHGNGYVAIGKDGTLLNFVLGTSKPTTAKLFALNQDSSTKFTKTYTLAQGTDYLGNISNISVGNDGTFYFLYNTYTGSNVPTPNSSLVAASPTDGAVLWSYPVEYGKGGIIRGADGTIYVYEKIYSFASQEKVFAINPNGTLKWSKNLGNNKIIADLQINLDDDVLLFFHDADYKTHYYILDNNDGSEKKVVDMGGYYYKFTYDSNGGVYSSPRYFDSSSNLRWQMVIPYSSHTTCAAGEDKSYFTGNPSLDERGWQYQGYTFACFQGGTYNAIMSECFTQVTGIAPWTLSSFTNVLFTGTIAGSTIDFTVTTSMLETNPVFGGTNQAQIIMDNGDIVPLTYSNLNSAGNSVWIGTYTLPSNTSVGTHTYTVEASQSHLRTDTTTHFESESTESQNTGITATGSFNVKAATVYTSPTITLTQNTKHTEEEITTEVEEEQETVSKKIKFVDRNGAPMVNAIIVIDGEEYLTDTKGEIELTNVDEARTYTARITYKGKTYQEEILGVIESEGEIAIDVAEDTVEKVEEKKINIWIYIVPGVIILFVGGLIILNKKRPI